MRKSSYSSSPYGKMRDRMAEERKRRKQNLNQKTAEYYAWLVSGVKARAT